MKKALLLLFFCLFTLPGHAKEPLRVISGAVTKVSDGDTVTAVDQKGTKLKVRLYGIDAPEVTWVDRKTGQTRPGQPYGKESQVALTLKVVGRPVTVEVVDIDSYKRLVAVLRVNGRNINQEMVRDGYAWAYRQYLDRPHASEYISVEEEARKAKRGLWQQSNPQPPWKFRHGKRPQKG